VSIRATPREVAAQVRDPELPMLTLADLGVLREVTVETGAGGDVVVATITPTYLGCPAMATIRDDLVHRLTAAGFPRVEVRVVLDPPWSSDWISEPGRAALRDHGLSVPGPAPHRSGPIPLTLQATRPVPACPAAARPGPSSSPSSARPPARPSTAAPPASSRSST
jgi:ring-1,2-phenylacetyl-CoA epoxidase subunit PaaD